MQWRIIRHGGGERRKSVLKKGEGEFLAKKAVVLANEAFHLDLVAATQDKESN
jgi:hypothetical protein